MADLILERAERALSRGRDLRKACRQLLEVSSLRRVAHELEHHLDAIQPPAGDTEYAGWATALTEARQVQDDAWTAIRDFILPALPSGH